MSQRDPRIEERPLVALSVRPPIQDIVPAPRQRDWMPTSAKLCLPLLIANQSGWELANPRPFTAVWDGGDSPAAVTLEQPEGSGGVSSHFGGGIVTWSIDYLFRTPPGWNLWVRGPVNRPKDGATPLEGVVEADWAEFTFTMNWKLTRPGLPVSFEADEPFCMIVPQARGELEAFAPRIADLEDHPDTARRFERSRRSRDRLQVQKFLAEHVPGMRQVRREWQGHYYHGSTPGLGKVADHQTRLKLKKFE